MRAAILAIALAVGIAGAATAQTDPPVGKAWHKFETPGVAMVGRSPMRLYEQWHWIDIGYVRSMGVTVEPALPGLEDRALKIDSGLALKIGDHHILRLVEQPEVMSEAGPIRHLFRAWLSQPRFYVVQVGCNECAVTYLIDERDGSVADIMVPPLMSPSGQLGLLWAQDFMGGAWAGPPIVIDFRSHPPAFRSAPGFPNCEKRERASTLRATPVWIDDATIKFDGPAPMPGDDPKALQMLRLSDGRVEWDCRN
jgi:hypothetical protein